MANIGVGPTVLIAAGVCAVGAFVSHVWGPETTVLSLAQTGQFEAVNAEQATAGAH